MYLIVIIKFHVMVLAHAIPPTIMRRLVTSLEIILEMIDTFALLDGRKKYMGL